MLTQKQVTFLSRVLAGCIFLIGSAVCLLLWYMEIKLDEEYAGLRVIVPFMLHLMAALAGFRAGINGILAMIIFTFLSLVAPFYLNNISFCPGVKISILYIALICAQLVLLIICVAKKREPSTPENETA